MKKEDVLNAVMAALQGYVSTVPGTVEPVSTDPVARSRKIARNACVQAAVVSGSLAVPPGPLGFLTVIPDLAAVWRIQSKMVADIAGAFGKTSLLSREQMLYCLFRHTATTVVHDLVIRVGERFLVKRASLKIVNNVIHKIGLRIIQRLARKSIARWLPVVGAVGVGAYAYYDTSEVAGTSIDLFKQDVELESGETTKPGPL